MAFCWAMGRRWERVGYWAMVRNGREWLVAAGKGGGGNGRARRVGQPCRMVSNGSGY